MYVTTLPGTTDVESVSALPMTGIGSHLPTDVAKMGYKTAKVVAEILHKMPVTIATVFFYIQVYLKV